MRGLIPPGELNISVNDGSNENDIQNVENQSHRKNTQQDEELIVHIYLGVVGNR